MAIAMKTRVGIMTAIRQDAILSQDVLGKLQQVLAGVRK
jgi:hypothetical protein